MNDMNFDNYKNLERIGGGILGGIAIIAAIIQLLFSGFTPANIASTIKDISGTLIVVLVLLAALRSLLPKKTIHFNEIFDEHMQSLIEKYSPLIKKDAQIVGRYQIANKVDVLYSDEMVGYSTLFNFDYSHEISFEVSKTLFMGRSKEDFSDMQKSIVTGITNKITRDFGDIVASWKATKGGFTLYFAKNLTTADDAKRVYEMIDKIILLYIVENKKQ